MSEKVKITLPFFISIFALIVIGFYSIINIQEFRNASDSVVHSKDVMFEAHNILSYLQSIETSHRGYVITGKKEFLHPRVDALRKIYPSLSKLKNLSSNDSIDTKLCDSLATLVYLKINASEEIIAKYQEEGFDEAQKYISTDSSKKMMDKSRILIDEIVNDEKIHLINKLQRSQKKFNVSVIIISTSALLSVLIIIMALFFLVRDMNKRIRSENQLSIYTKELEMKNKELEQFVKVASHDFKEPLKTISNYSNLFQEEYKEKLDGNTTKYLNSIHEASNRIKKLIDDLLEYMQIGNNKNISEIDCNSLLKEVLKNLDSSIKESSAEIHLDRMPVINGYRNELILLFQNIIGNAIKYRSKNRQLIIEITSINYDGEWIFTIKDNGIGIEEKYKERIFDIFQRLHGHSEYSGTGMGLALCSKIVKMHRGRIWLESEFGKGSIFHFTIPK